VNCAYGFPPEAASKVTRATATPASPNGAGTRRGSGTTNCSGGGGRCCSCVSAFPSSFTQLLGFPSDSHCDGGS
jgi:hypothetical protein